MGADFIYVMCEVSVPYELAFSRIEKMKPEEIADKWSMDFDPEIDFHGEAYECLNYVYDPPRDADTVTIEGKRFVLTGGLSYGDDPTDSFDPIYKIYTLGVTQ